MKEILINGKYKLKLPDYRESQWKEPWEAERIDSMIANLTPNDIVMDIGAECGDITALLAQRCKFIYIVEPSPHYWITIKDIFEANKITAGREMFVGFASNVDHWNAYNKNFDDRIVEGWPQCAYGVHDPDLGFRHLHQEADATPQIKIDRWLSEMPLSLQPTMLTIDVEGAEFEVLKGAEQTLRLCKPIVYVSIHEEFMKDNWGHTRIELITYMNSLGYALKHLTVDHESQDIFYHPEGKKLI